MPFSLVFSSLEKDDGDDGEEDGQEEGAETSDGDAGDGAGWELIGWF